MTANQETHRPEDSWQSWIRGVGAFSADSVSSARRPKGDSVLSTPATSNSVSISLNNVAGKESATDAARPRPTDRRRRMNERPLAILRKYPEGADRARVLELLNDRPRSDYELANALDLDYGTIQDQLSALLEVNLVQTSNRLYGDVYLLTNEARQRWNTIETIIHHRMR